MSNVITEEMSIPEIVEKYPQPKPIFKQYGIQVEGYKAIEHENLFATSRVHQIDLPKILKDLNQSVSH